MHSYTVYKLMSHVTLFELHNTPERKAILSTLQGVSEKQIGDPFVIEDQNSRLGLLTPCLVVFVGSNLHTGEKDVYRM